MTTATPAKKNTSPTTVKKAVKAPAKAPVKAVQTVDKTAAPAPTKAVTTKPTPVTFSGGSPFNVTSWSSETDPYNMFNTSTGVFTAPVAGLWLLTTTALAVANTVSVNAYVIINNSDSTAAIAQSGYMHAMGSGAYMTATGVANLAVNNTAQVQFAATNADTAFNFAGVYLGPTS